MRTWKSLFGVILALVPILYCGSLLFYFLDLSGSLQEAQTNGLGPTLLGLAAVGLLFCIPLVMKIVRILSGPGSDGRGGPDESTRDGEFDPDAAVARYMARRAAETAPGSPSAPSTRDHGGPAKRPSFGRKIR